MRVCPSPLRAALDVGANPPCMCTALCAHHLVYAPCYVTTANLGVVPRATANPSHATARYARCGGQPPHRPFNNTTLAVAVDHLVGAPPWLGYLTPAFSGAHMLAELLRNPCVLGGPQTRGQHQKWLHHPCLFGGPTSGRKCYVTRAFLGVPKQGDKIKSGYITPELRYLGQKNYFPSLGASLAPSLLFRVPG